MTIVFVIIIFSFFLYPALKNIEDNDNELRELRAEKWRKDHM